MHAVPGGLSESTGVVFVGRFETQHRQCDEQFDRNEQPWQEVCSKRRCYQMSQVPFCACEKCLRESGRSPEREEIMTYNDPKFRYACVIHQRTPIVLYLCQHRDQNRPQSDLGHSWSPLLTHRDFAINPTAIQPSNPTQLNPTKLSPTQPYEITIGLLIYWGYTVHWKMVNSILQTVSALAEERTRGPGSAWIFVVGASGS